MVKPSPRILSVDSIAADVELVRDQVKRRAREISETRENPFGSDLDNWLAAEAELMWKPPIEVSEKDDCFLVEVAVPGVSPNDIDIRVTPEDLLISTAVRHEHMLQKGTVHTCEFPSGVLFRTVRFPKRITPDKVQTEFRNGMLMLTVEVAKQGQTQTVEGQPSNPPKRVKRRAAGR